MYATFPSKIIFFLLSTFTKLLFILCVNEKKIYKQKFLFGLYKYFTFLLFNKFFIISTFHLLKIYYIIYYTIVIIMLQLIRCIFIVDMPGNKWPVVQLYVVEIEYIYSYKHITLLNENATISYMYSLYTIFRNHIWKLLSVYLYLCLF